MAIRVVAGLIRDGDRLLICQRSGRGPFPLKWEFPGGKLEEGEGEFDALRRELREELAIETQSAVEIYRARHRYPEGVEVDLAFYRVDGFLGTVVNRAFRELRWASLQELRSLDFLEGDLSLIEKLIRGELRF